MQAIHIAEAFRSQACSIRFVLIQNAVIHATDFGIEGQARGLRIGQFLTVLATTVDEKSGVAIPRSAVLRAANGQSLVFEHTNAERFVPREVRVEPLDAGRVLIISGIGAGKRIATQGAELLNQIR